MQTTGSSQLVIPATASPNSAISGCRTGSAGRRGAADLVVGVINTATALVALILPPTASEVSRRHPLAPDLNIDHARTFEGMP